ncbi:hypothetical protein ACFQY4_15075 [Catellatospora bangladeshensis]|uniref:Uncharacterized protein n=1 Tax=Catellatospora bangladeshensis TaxID=310355 RepID=A0A8J3NKJ3_9ACTN|nr:hypothetical protein [Catellatospora bangladeshensis]GIF83068.1 hypothetical protein Cba03nite_44170 [Catellatospora bangladeshensis]
MAEQHSHNPIIDLDDPPVKSPDGCVDPTMWQLAREVFTGHPRNAAGECTACPRWKACTGRALAREGLATALGATVKNSPYWIAYADLRGSKHAKARAKNVD